MLWVIGAHTYNEKDGGDDDDGFDNNSHISGNNANGCKDGDGHDNDTDKHDK